MLQFVQSFSEFFTLLYTIFCANELEFYYVLSEKKNVASVYIGSVYNCCLIQDSGTITEEKKKKSRR